LSLLGTTLVLQGQLDRPCPHRPGTFRPVVHLIFGLSCG